MPATSISPSGQPLPLEVLQETAAMFGLLAATARLQVVWLLAAGERDVSTLAAEVGQSVAAVSQHLAKLKLAGLVRSRREGRHQVYLVDDPQVVELVRLMAGHHTKRAVPSDGRRSHGA